jgi:ketosteroid isomerase-like protein
MSEVGSPTAPGEKSGKSLLDELLAALMAKDLPRMMSLFADDAVVYDPHYPQPRMVGKAAVQQGLEWGLSTLEKPGFAVRHVWLSDDSGVAEVDTHHVIRGGVEAKFEQVFVFEVRDGKFTRFQAYVPYRPHGIAGLMGQTTGLMWRLQGKLK